MKMKIFNKATFLGLAIMLLFVQLSLSVVALDSTIEKTAFEIENCCEFEAYEETEMEYIPATLGLEMTDLEKTIEEELNPVEAMSSPSCASGHSWRQSASWYARCGRLISVTPSVYCTRTAEFWTFNCSRSGCGANIGVNYFRCSC